ncbi:MAG TPA: hypothetical protein DEP63_00240 [Candidatus Magasanikbacteria bacterium]|nr:hypothetical protein [Candidatus Magasanikbacteria bacterium]HCC13166.1 hypothetical protein [Candidatus Magasanikbacteria bacterium]HCM53972.1 hypothetical protein [Candidatus Magasanikbacteria bacterium]
MLAWGIHWAVTGKIAILTDIVYWMRSINLDHSGELQIVFLFAALLVLVLYGLFALALLTALTTTLLSFFGGIWWLFQRLPRKKQSPVHD